MANIPKKSVERRPRLVVFEGPDGAGKSTLAKGLLEYFAENSLKAELFSFPGDKEGSLGKSVYDIHHYPERLGIDSIDMTSLQALHVAAHIDAIEKQIIPSLDSGATVILDRYWWSTWAYGLVYGANEASLKKIVQAELVHWGKIKPSILFLVRRATPIDRKIEDSLWARLNEEYEKLAIRERRKYNIQVINNEESIAESTRKVTDATAKICGKNGS